MNRLETWCDMGDARNLPDLRYCAKSKVVHLFGDEGAIRAVLITRRETEVGQVAALLLQVVGEGMQGRRGRRAGASSSPGTVSFFVGFILYLSLLLPLFLPGFFGGREYIGFPTLAAGRCNLWLYQRSVIGSGIMACTLLVVRSFMQCAICGNKI